MAVNGSQQGELMGPSHSLQDPGLPARASFAADNAQTAPGSTATGASWSGMQPRLLSCSTSHTLDGHHTCWPAGLSANPRDPIGCLVDQGDPGRGSPNQTVESPLQSRLDY